MTIQLYPSLSTGIPSIPESMNIPEKGLYSIIWRWMRKITRYFTRLTTSESESRQAQLFSIATTRHMPMINRICFTYSNSTEDFEDLRQDILMNVWNGLPNYKADASLSTWLYRVALNTCVSTIRTRRRRPATISLRDLSIDIPDSSSDSSLTEHLHLLHQCIASLTPVEKAIITMRLDRCGYEEIAEVVGISPSNVGVRINRIKKKMSARLNPV